MDLTQKFQRNKNIVYREEDDGAFLFNPETGKFADEYLHLKINAGVIGPTFTVGNESGTVTKKLPIAVITAWPKTLADGEFKCIDTE